MTASGFGDSQPAQPKWCIRQVVCSFLVLGALRQGLVLFGSTAMTLRVRPLGDDEADELARMARSRTLGAGLVRRAQDRAACGGARPERPRDRRQDGPVRCHGSVL